MPNRHFLTEKTGLGQQVAAFLPESLGRESLLITPTSGATRSISRWAGLSKEQSQTILQPMQALLPVHRTVANPVERCLAWATVLQQSSKLEQESLFWKRAPESSADWLKAGRNLIRLCDKLAEAGLSPETFQLPETKADYLDQDRWSSIKVLYRNYLDCLQAWKLHDPNALRLERILESSDPSQRIIIACIPDLPVAFELYASRLERKGTHIDILVWNPQQVDAHHFDLWGRPIVEIWNNRIIGIEDTQIHTAASTLDEAQAIVTIMATGKADLVVADPEISPTIASQLRAQSLRPYLPEGKPLIRSEAAKLSLEWNSFRQNQDLRCLRRLLELPAFTQSLDKDNPLTLSDALLAIDHLLGTTVASDLDAAWAASPVLHEGAPIHEVPMRTRVRRLLGLVRKRLSCPATEIIEEAFPQQSDAPPSTAQRVHDLLKALECSPAVSTWMASNDEKTIPQQVLTQAIRHEQVQSAAGEGVITLNGWLEAPWLEQDHLVLCGLIEGCIPQGVDGDPFLPDSICTVLGLSHNNQRLARDAYLLDALLASRPQDQVHLSYSKYKPQGDPNRPSRLLLRTGNEALAERTRKIIHPATMNRARPSRSTNWRWQLPDPLPKIRTVSPTQFEHYLACPFRFCLTKVLSYETALPAAREMDASVFGNLIHKALENFGSEAIRDGRGMLNYSEEHILIRVQQLLQEEAQRLFGPNPMPAVQVQLANAVARLHGFARVQAECFAEGWVILEVERKLSSDCDAPLKIGPLHLTGVIDRIEQNVEGGALRVMDYKTFSTKKTPSDTHLGPISHNWLPAALVELNLGRHLRQKTWKNLQLPLYLKILEHWYPEETAALEPETAYFLLPSDPQETGIYSFDTIKSDLNPEAYASALACAEAVAQHIDSGIYWPPQPFRNNWDDPLDAILINGKAEDCIHPDTIKKLKGGGE